jgi:protein-arginine kinase activator protein McsA
MDDLLRYLDNNRSWAIYLLFGGLFAIIAFAWIKGKLKPKDNLCPGCKKPDVYKVVKTENLGTKTEYKQKWDYTNSKWFEAHVSTTSTMHTYQCSSCGYTLNVPRDDEKDLD